MIKLYSYFRSSASYRVRAALYWKQLEFEYIPVHLVKDGGMQNTPEFRKINPMGHVPAIEHNGFVLSESMAIIQYLDDISPTAPLFPLVPENKARAIQIAELVNSGIQPLQNLKVQKLLEQTYHLPKSDSDGFVRHWIEDGFNNLEKLLNQTAGTYCVGADVTVADCFVVPQCLTARRFGVDVDNYPNIARVNANALKLPAFQKAHPEQQPDFAK